MGGVLSCIGPRHIEGRARQSQAPILPENCLDRPLETLGILSPPSVRRPKEAQAAYDRGAALMEAKDYMQAIDAFAVSLAADSSFGPAHLGKAASHLYGDYDLDRVGHHASRAVVLMSENAEAHLRFAQFQAELSESEFAARHYECALILDDGLMAARRGLATQQLLLKRFSEAEAQLRRLPASADDAVKLPVMLSDALAGQGKFREAATEMESAANAAGPSAALLRRASRLYTLAGDDDTADRLLQQADRIDPPRKRRRMRPLKPAKPPPPGKR